MQQPMDVLPLFSVDDPDCPLSSVELVTLGKNGPEVYKGSEVELWTHGATKMLTIFTRSLLETKTFGIRGTTVTPSL